jgi:hypothetical protein
MRRNESTYSSYTFLVIVNHLRLGTLYVNTKWNENSLSNIINVSILSVKKIITNTKRDTF